MLHRTMRDFLADTVVVHGAAAVPGDAEAAVPPPQLPEAAHAAYLWQGTPAVIGILCERGRRHDAQHGL